MLGFPFVTSERAALARVFEKRFQALPPEAGIIFAAVDAVPVVGGRSTEFKILLGISKRLDESVGWAFIPHVMRDEIKEGEITLTASVFRGVSGACRDESAEGAHPSPAPTNDPS